MDECWRIRPHDPGRIASLCLGTRHFRNAKITIFMTRRKVDRSAKLARRVTIRMSESFYKRRAYTNGIQRIIFELVGRVCRQNALPQKKVTVTFLNCTLTEISLFLLCVVNHGVKIANRKIGCFYWHGTITSLIRRPFHPKPKVGLLRNLYQGHG